MNERAGACRQKRCMDSDRERSGWQTLSVSRVAGRTHPLRGRTEPATRLFTLATNMLEEDPSPVGDLHTVILEAGDVRPCDLPDGALQQR